jgi:HEPN domain-containing protein
MKKQTAVEWLVNELEKHHIKLDLKNTVVFLQAKEMEKEQIEQAYWDGWQNIPSMSPKQYYSEIFTQYPDK